MLALVQFGQSSLARTARTRTCQPSVREAPTTGRKCALRSLDQYTMTPCRTVKLSSDGHPASPCGASKWAATLRGATWACDATRPRRQTDAPSASPAAPLVDTLPGTRQGTTTGTSL